jgi:radical SAM protein with 4Fe4S-binding SPASM domain
MRLGDNIVLVQGSKRVALYDMGRNTLMRAPRFVSELVSQDHEGGRPPAGCERKVVDALVARGYLHPIAEPGWQAYRADAALPGVSPLANVIVDASEGNLARLSAVLESDPWAHLVRHVVFVLRGDSRRRALAGIATRHGCSFELAEGGDGRLRSEIYSRKGRHVGTRTASDAVNVRSYLQIEYNTMVLLRNYVESAGTLYVDPEGTIYPHFSEKHFVLGDFGAQTLAQVVEGDNYRRHIGNRKDLRQRCGACELRLACLRSFVDRVDPSDIASAPASCQYDPELDSYQNALFN